MGEGASGESSRGSWRGVLRQLIREMGFPFLIASLWTGYSLLAASNKRNVVDAISVFGGSFFLACWAFSQWFRVKKQQAVESGLGGIVKKQEGLVAALTEATERLEGFTSGGKSIGWLMLVNTREGAIRDITAHVEGIYPLIDARVSILDRSKAHMGLEDFKRTGNMQDFFKHHVMLDCGMLQPNLATMQNLVLPYDASQSSLHFQLEWIARNGKWTQFVELKWNGAGYESYTAVRRGDDWVFENPKRESIPKRADGKPDVFWHTELAEAFNSGGT